MVFQLNTISRNRFFPKALTLAALALAGSALAAAAPKLQLANANPAVVSIGQASAGSLSIDAANVGDGALSLQATSTASWIVPTVGASHACTDGSGPACLPINMALQTTSLASGLYVAQVFVNDPNAIDAPQVITVSVQIGLGVPGKIDFTVTQASLAYSRFAVTGQAQVTASGGAWLSVAQDGGTPFSPNLPFKVTASAGALALGDSTAALTVIGATAPADNKTIPVTLHVVKAVIAGPLSNIGGALNNTTYQAGEALAQGDIAALFGSAFTAGDPAGVTALPLATTLGAAQVFMNDQPVPLYYVSAGQINFQVPFNAPIGQNTLRVELNGVRGNTISLTVARAVPRILRLNGKYGDYGIVTNPDNTITIPGSLGGVPAKIGGALVIYTIGLGPTNPAVASGAASPSAEPLARVTNNPQVCFKASTPFSAGLCVNPIYAGLAPGFVGLYQVNVIIPNASPTGDIVPIYLKTDDGNSNSINIAIQ